MRYRQEPEVPPTVVWLVNPDGRVIDMTDEFPQVDKAKGGLGGWKLANDEQIKTAKAEREAESKAHSEKQERIKAVKQTAVEMTVAASEIIKEEGASAPTPTPKPKKTAKQIVTKGKGDAA